jgi:acyl-CoA synthetase (AMP-forming)/AMP-acid ligase II
MTGCNIATTLEKLAEEIPNNPALLVPWLEKRVLFRELHEESNCLASGFSKLGIRQGQRILLLVPFSIEFITLTFALFKAGAVPVLIDPGLGRKNALQCIDQAEPEGIVSIPLGHLARILFPRPFRSVRHSVTVGRRWLWGGKTLDQIRALGSQQFTAASTSADDPAAILFTSGSTGPSKGVLYTHGMFSRQVELLQNHYGIQMGEIDLPTFPLFGLFGTAMGMTCVLPEMDFTRPAKVNPEKIIGPIRENNVTSSFGSPALWNTVSRHCLKHKIQLPSVRRILMAGAPVPGSLLKRFDTIVDPACEIATPYGATEALPVSSIDRKEILGETWEQTEAGLGTCVGRPVPGIRVKIIEIRDEPIAAWNDTLELNIGEAGEIVVQGSWVTQKYFNREDATRLSKIEDGDSFWHRMGDIGSLDNLGRLWFYGRKNHRVEMEAGTLFTIPCEAIFNRHPGVKRSALVGIGEKGRQTPAIIIEAEEPQAVDSESKRNSLKKELLEMGRRNEVTRTINTILFHPGFPVDIRHNAKIFREKLTVWAENKLSRP